MPKHNRYTDKKKFEDHLKDIQRKITYLGGYKIYTTEAQSNGIQTNELVYIFRTGNKKRFILVYSSIEIESGCFRERGKDAVRFVYQEYTPNGVYYYRIGKCYRTANLCENMRKKLQHAVDNIFRIKIDKFKKSLDDLNSE